MVGSPYWMAPEVLRDEPYNEKVGMSEINTVNLKCCLGIFKQGELVLVPSIFLLCKLYFIFLSLSS